MTFLPTLALAWLTAAVTATVAAAPLASQELLAPEITGLRVQRFENKSGRLTEDVLTAPSTELWNSIAGPHAANSALIVVELRGQPDASYSGRPGAGRRYGLRLVASERRRARPLLDQSQTLPVMGPDGKTFVAFLVQPQGCTPLRLSATVVGPHAGKAVVVVVPYACGE